MDNGESVVDRSSEEIIAPVPGTNGAAKTENGLRTSADGPPQVYPRTLASEPSPVVESVMQSDVCARASPQYTCMTETVADWNQYPTNTFEAKHSICASVFSVFLDS